jgi:Zn-dependent metalloprotease
MKKILCVLVLAGLALSSEAQSSDDPAVKQLAAMLQPATEGAGDAAIIKNSYRDPQTGLQFINLEQQYKGIRVFNAVNTSVFRDNTLQSSRSTFINGIAARAPLANPSLSAADAIGYAARYLQLPDARCASNRGKPIRVRQDHFVCSRGYCQAKYAGGTGLGSRHR